jgi:hypothetical protein
MKISWGLDSVLRICQNLSVKMTHVWHFKKQSFDVSPARPPITQASKSVCTDTVQNGGDAKLKPSCIAIP